MYILIGIIALLSIIAIFYFLSKGKADSASASPEDDAKRFARLLVSEIKLYNENKVQLGLQNNNLFDILRDEIGEARIKYKKRIPQADLENNFDDALVEILADGNQDKLGSGIRSCFK